MQRHDPADEMKFGFRAAVAIYSLPQKLDDLFFGNRAVPQQAPTAIALVRSMMVEGISPGTGRHPR